jgi:hypothetical protein
LSATDRPFFRTDLVSRPIESSGHRFIEVTDPDSGHSFRFYEIEYAIACAMDGERDVDELADWAKYELGLDPSRDEIQTVIGTLGDLGYLDIGESTGDGAGQAVGYERSAAPTQPPPLDRPPPAGRTTDVSPFDLPRDRVSDLSTDLSEHIPVRAADVKEAVRQSRAIQAQKPPIEVVDEDEAFDDQKTPVPAARQPVRAAAAAAAAKPDKGRDARGEPAMSAALGKTLLGTMAPVQPPTKGGRSSTPAPMVLPETPTEISSPHAAAASTPSASGRPATNPSIAPAARSTATARDSAVQPMLPARRPGGLLPYLIVLLLLSGAGALAYWWFFVRAGETEQGSTDESGAPPTAPSAIEGSAGGAGGTAAVPTPEPTPPAEITATLEAGPTEEQVVAADRAGLVAWVAASGTEVAEGAPVAKYDGYQKWDYAVKEAQDSQKRYQEKLDQATSKADNDAMKEADGNVKRKQGDIDRNLAELDKFLVKAPIGGVVEPSIKQRSQVKKDQPVAKILVTAPPRASFALPAGTASPGGEVRVVSKADPGLAATCRVVSAAGGQLAVTCPTDSGLASGSEVVLKLP